MNSTDTTIYARNKNLRPKLFIINGNDIGEYYLEGKQVLGRRTRDNNPDINISAGTVSRRHGLFITSGNRAVYQDIGSSNGTIAAGGVLQKGMHTELVSGSVLRIRARNASSTEKDIVMIYTTEYPERSSWREVSLRGDIRSLEIGRGEGIFLQDETASRRHATFFLARNGWAIIDNNSKNGVFLNGRRVGEPVLLRPMDVVTIANHIFVFRGNSLLIQADEAVRQGSGALNHQGAQVWNTDENGPYYQEAALMGSALNKSPAAERGRSGSFVRSNAGNMHPSNVNPGNVNPGNVNPRNVNPGKVNQANMNPGNGAPGILTPGRQGGIDFGRMSPGNVDSGGMYSGRRDNSYADGFRGDCNGKVLSIHIVERNVWNRLRKKTILSNISMRIDSGSLVLILGGSGAGKTTFMNAVMGYEPAKGSIAYGQSDIYREYEKMKYEIGYVPQQDLLRMEDVVFDTLDNAAHMRLPDTISPAERERVVMNALNMFGLSREKDSLVGKLSGGQRKRLSIAVEYIGNPSLFFLDEPDSGLDGIMARELMVNLRQIADQGKIVMVISHAPDRAFDLFDKIIVLAKSERDDSGHLVYYGSPADACRFFDTETLEGIVGRVNRRDEGGQGLADAYIRKYETMIKTAR